MLTTLHRKTPWSGNENEGAEARGGTGPPFIQHVMLFLSGSKHQKKKKGGPGKQFLVVFTFFLSVCRRCVFF